jgi:diguanylate cyclase (GGDEF)-like protein
MLSPTRRNILFSISLAVSALLTWNIVLNLSELRNTVFPETHLIHIGLSLAGFFFPIIGGWFCFQFIGGLIFAIFAAIMVFFVGSVSTSPVFVWFLIEYAILCYFLFRVDQDFENQIAGISVDLEKYQNEKNDLEITHKAKGEGISILFEKYSTYYNLRKLAEELATTLSVSALAQIIVNHAMELIGHGDIALISVVNSEHQSLSMNAFKQAGKHSENKTGIKTHSGDHFDMWVIKNQRRLIVIDAHQDFRFDVKETSRLEDLKSLIISPLVNERRLIGTLRMNAAKPEVFSNDDLRLLDTISVLASSAISNAMLYEQTEELAIRDSLTNLYVRRYFYERLKEEHRRSLLTKRPLSLLMCDLDHFKECNDRYGHAVGDLMLIQFANILLQTSENAIVARYGGEEFAVLLPEATKQQAIELADKIRITVQNKPFELRRDKIDMTVSIGVSNLPDDAFDLEDLVQRADQALYQAKRQGRNQVCASAS